MPYSSQALDADRENGPAARSFGADAHDRIMVRIKRSYRIQVCGTKMRPQWRAPLGSLNRPTDRHRSDTEAMPKARLAVHRRSACSGVKALRNTSHARRQAAKLCYRFGPLTPSARSANLIAGDGTKNGLSRSEQKTGSKTQNNRLTGKAPYKSGANPTFRGASHQWREQRLLAAREHDVAPKGAVVGNPRRDAHSVPIRQEPHAVFRSFEQIGEFGDGFGRETKAVVAAQTHTACLWLSLPSLQARRGP